jgi:hypothetical protein
MSARPSADPKTGERLLSPTLSSQLNQGVDRPCDPHGESDVPAGNPNLHLGVAGAAPQCCSCNTVANSRWMT